MTDPRTLVLSWLRTLTRGKPSTAVVTIPVSELLDLEGQLRDARGKVSRSRKPKGMTSRSKQRRKPDTAYLRFVASQPCCSCGTTRNVESHHWGTKAQKGMGMRAPDHQAVPLCDTCHRHEGFHRWGTLPGMSKRQTMELFASVREHLQKRWAERQNGEEF